jgi:hypothetical protein
MKKLMLVILLTFALISCSKKEPEPKLEGWYLRVEYDKGWSWSTIKCDSLQMVSKTEAFVWVNGKKVRIIGDSLIPRHY